MKKLILALAAASSVTVASAGVSSTQMNVGVTVAPRSYGEPRIEKVANPLPPVIGWIRNRAQGQIVLATEKCSSDPSLQFAFIKDDGGKLSVTGCWQMIGEDIVIRWSDGDVYSYPVESIEFTASFNEWSERNRREKGNRNQF